MKMFSVATNKTQKTFRYSASDFQSSLSEEKLTDLSPFRRKMGPVAKNLFQGQVSYNRIDQM